LAIVSPKLIRYLLFYLLCRKADTGHWRPAPSLWRGFDNGGSNSIFER
jgi:hypothetical protein